MECSPDSVETSFEGVIRVGYQLASGVKRIENYRNAFSILSEWMEKNFKVFSLCLLRNKMSCLEKNAGVLSQNDRLSGFFEKYRDLLVVQSKSKKGRSLLVRKGLDMISTGNGRSKPSRSVRSRKKKIAMLKGEWEKLPALSKSKSSPHTSTGSV